MRTHICSIGKLYVGVLAATAAIISSGVATAATINVPADQATIQACINASVDGDKCIVATGTYIETINFNGKAITLQSTDPSDPAVVATTIIDGNAAGTVVACASGEGPDTVLDGFTITNGNGTLGGGMLNHGSSPTVRNCTFTANSSSTGGGMYNSLSSPTIVDCTFTANTCDNRGGGISNSDGSSPTVTRCLFDANEAGSGGAMFNDASSPIVTSCTFTGNTSRGDCGGMYSFESAAIVTNCVFSGNAGNNFSGAMLNLDGSVTVTNSTFYANSANFAGGIFNFMGNPTVTNCILWNNTNGDIANETTALTLSYTNAGVIRGSVATDAGGNIASDPFFADPDGLDDIPGTPDDNLRLLIASPCIDAGNSDAPALIGVLTDLDGANRFADSPTTPDTGVGASPIVDMGAFEIGLATGTNRYIRLSPQAIPTGQEIIRVTIVSVEGFAVPSPDVLYVGPPSAAPDEDNAKPGQMFLAARLQCEPYAHDWSSEGVVAAYGAEVMPNSTYDLQLARADCPDFPDESCWSAPTRVQTPLFGDIVAPFFPEAQRADFRDISAAVQKFLGTPGAPIKALAQLQPNIVAPTQPISFLDINVYVQAFLGAMYAELPFATGPCLCPSLVTCGATTCNVSGDCIDGFCIDGSCSDMCGRCTP